MSFHSSFTKLGPTVKQTLYFCGGQIRTIKDIITSKIKQSEYTELTCTNGVIWRINPKKVNYFTAEAEADKPLEDIQQTDIKKIYHFSDGSKLCLDNISEIKQGEFIKVSCTDGIIWSINPENVIAFEDIPDGIETKEAQDPEGESTEGDEKPEVEETSEPFYKDYLEFLKSDSITDSTFYKRFRFPNENEVVIKLQDEIYTCYVYIKQSGIVHDWNENGKITSEEDILTILENTKNLEKK